MAYNFSILSAQVYIGLHSLLSSSEYVVEYRVLNK